MVFFPSATDNHVVAEAQGHAGYQFPRLLDEAGHFPSSLSMYTGPGGVLAGVCPKVLGAESTSTYSAQ